MKDGILPAAAVAGVFVAVTAAAVILGEMQSRGNVKKRAARIVSDVERALCLAYKALR